MIVVNVVLSLIFGVLWVCMVGIWRYEKRKYLRQLGFLLALAFIGAMWIFQTLIELATYCTR